ncbi:MAG: 6-bladed beta-propeller [Gemmatimonadales bacterium]
MLSYRWLRTLVPPSVLLLAATGCSGAEARMLAQPVIDSLPGGIPRVMSPAATQWAGETGWQLELVQEITGEEGAESELINPQSIAIDDWGRVYVVDQKPMTIKVYGPDGAFIRTIGREGEGPGEFRVGFLAVHNGHVVIHDPRVARTSVWDTAGTFQRSWTSSCCYWSDIQVDRQARIYVPTMIQAPRDAPSRGTPYVRWKMQGAAVDTIWVPRNESQSRTWTVSTGSGTRSVARMMMTVPLTPRIVSTLNPDGGVVYGWSGDYQIAVSSAGEDTSMVFGRSWTPVPITAERKRFEVEAMIAQVGPNIEDNTLRQTFKTEDIPDAAPAYISVNVDREGHRWLRLDPGMDSTRSTFDIFNAEGVYLGALGVSPALPLYGRMAFGRGELVVARENEDGLPVVARYAIRK